MGKEIKIAVCFHGLTDNYEGSFPLIYENILSKYNPDIYIHGWEANTTRVTDILSKYKPVSYILEQQIDFSKYFNSIYCEKYEQSGNAYSKLFSYTYSRKRVIELLPDGYDCVLLCRFDAYNWRGRKNVDISNIIFNPTLDMNFLYSKIWNQLNAGFAEQWFYSNSNNIKLLSTLYDKIPYYLSTGSSYLNTLRDGWMDSNRVDEFSNEVLKPIELRSRSLIGNDLCVLNNHYLYKFFIYDVGLIDKCKFI